MRNQPSIASSEIQGLTPLPHSIVDREIRCKFNLEEHRESLMVEDDHLKPLRDFRPRRPHYIERGKRTAGRLVTDWNLILPEEVLHRSWGEVP